MNRYKFYVILLLITLSWSNSSLHAQFWGAVKPRPFDTPADSLKKGEFTWSPALSPQGPILVIVSLDEQKAFTYRNGVLIGIATASTGKKGHETPTGVFHTLLKDAKHRSKKYDNAPMPFTQKFTQYGIELHAGGLPGYPSSHGCVHLPSEYARLLFNEAQLGMTVVVSRNTQKLVEMNHPGILSPVSPDGKSTPHNLLTSTETLRWTPEKSTNGPVTILISRTDQRMIVSRAGIEIGRAKIGIKNPVDSTGTNVYVANAGNQSIKWNVHPVIDQSRGYIMKGDPSKQLERVEIPDAFLQLLIPQLQEGATIVLTDAPIIPKTSGRQLAVNSSHPGTSK